MSKDLHNISNSNHTNSNKLLSPNEIINAMIDLRIQLAELEQQIQDLQPAFRAACMALKTEKIELERAIISRRLTPAQWTYSKDILQQQDLIKQLKHQFQLDHEPTGGRDITWMIRMFKDMLSNPCWSDRTAASRKIRSNSPIYPPVAGAKTFCILALLKFEAWGSFKT
ncbi:hypothetical protein NIES4106_56560 (plasmid) [Fischerella sp. NIES-4106]|nr:hypothetical protein NIES4106_56560 [Fischerella sp. NIES-4106]